MSDVTILRPDSVVDRERAEEAARQAERRRLAHDYIVAVLGSDPRLFAEEKLSQAQIGGCLLLADMLIAATEVKP